ncbi:MAG: hypothetical protein WA192_15350, partial [Candidatus Acidiferrales bacterium]
PFAPPRVPLPAAHPAYAAPAAPPPPRVAVAPPAAETQKLRNEVRCLELLVKKLQAELEAQKQYCSALEAHCKTMQDAE